MGRRQILMATIAALAISLRRVFLRDDTAYIQGIVNAQSPTGFVRIPGGYYNIFAPIEIPDGVREFNGGGSVWHWRGNAVGPVFRFHLAA